MPLETSPPVDVRDLASRILLAAPNFHAFRDESTKQAIDMNGSGHAVFDECKIWRKVMRVGVEASDV
jgi:hypothetical protein